MGVGSLRKKPKRRAAEFSPPMTSSSPIRLKAAASAADRYKTYFRRRAALISSLVALCVLLLFCVTLQKTTSHVSPPPPPPPPPRFYSFDIVNEFPHDPNAFTQGLLYGGNDTLFESTGLYHRSSVRQVHLQTGKVLLYYPMDGSLFGEGLTLLGERLFQVTWLKKFGFVYDRYNFSKWEMFSHQMQDGWGLATDGKVIFGTDGSSTLYQLDPITWKVRRRAIVTYDGRDVRFLNELEYINGEVWANIWQTDCIARISQNDGKVLGWILLHELKEKMLRAGYTDIDVLNGIAWDEEKNRLFVTGKLWPKLYEIKLRQVPGPLNGKIEELCPI